MTLPPKRVSDEVVSRKHDVEISWLAILATQKGKRSLDHGQQVVPSSPPAGPGSDKSQNKRRKSKKAT
jgi:hypothetical protein